MQYANNLSVPISPYFPPPKMKTRDLFITLVVLVGLSAHPLRANQSAGNESSDSLKWSDVYDRSFHPLTLTEAEKAKFRAIILKRRDESKYDFEVQSLEKHLIRLGDTDLAKTYISKRLDADLIHVGNCLIDSGNPDVLLALGPVLFRDEPYRVAPGDVPISNASHFVALGIIPMLLSNSRAFNADVTNWIRKFNDDERNPIFYKDPDASREMIRDWWKENEARFRARDFKNVTPGRLGPPPPVVEAGIPITPPKLRPTPTPPPPATLPPHPRLEAQEPQTSGNLWLWFTGITALLAAVALILKRKTDKPH